MTGAGGLRRVAEPFVRDLEVPLPGLERQHAIVDYLDHETTEIDILIHELSALAERTSERFESELSARIPYPQRADGLTSGNGLAPIKRLGTITLGKMLDSSRNREPGETHRYLRAANVQPLGRIDLTDVKTMRFTNAEKEALDLRGGDVIIVEGGQGGYGRAAYLPEDIPDTGFQNSIVRVRPRPGVDGRFITYSLILLRVRGYIKSVAATTSMPHFTAEKVAVTPVPLLALSEQTEIADRLDRSGSEARATETEIARAINLAKERRAALITAAVTGQIDVTAKHRPAAEQLEDDIKELP
nr:restriction endonuclease subunit S [Brachybacterium equifaecis]